MIMLPSFFSMVIILSVVIIETQTEVPTQVCHILWQFWVDHITASCPDAKCNVMFDLYPESESMSMSSLEGILHAGTPSTLKTILNEGKNEYTSKDSRLQFSMYTKIDEGTPDPVILRFRNDEIMSNPTLCKVQLAENQEGSVGKCVTGDDTEPNYSIDAPFAYKSQRCCEMKNRNMTQPSCKATLILSDTSIPTAPTATELDVNNHIVTTTIESSALVSKDSMILIISIAGAALILLFSFAVALVMIKKHIKKKGKGKESEQMESTKSRKKKYSSIKSKIRSLTSAVSKKKTKIRHRPISVSEKKSTSKSKMRTGTDLTPGDSTQKSHSNSDYDIVRPHYLLMNKN